MTETIGKLTLGFHLTNGKLLLLLLLPFLRFELVFRKTHQLHQLHQPPNRKVRNFEHCLARYEQTKKGLSYLHHEITEQKWNTHQTVTFVKYHFNTLCFLLYNQINFSNVKISLSSKQLVIAVSSGVLISRSCSKQSML